MMSVELPFWILGVMAFLAAIYGMKRYQSPLNPLTIFAVTQIGMFTILSGIITINMIPTIGYDGADIVETTLISGVFLGGTTLPYLFYGSLPANLYGKGLGLLGLRSGAIATRFSHVKFGLIMAGATGSFVALALVGSGGILWLTDTRQAYITSRAGVGPLYALTQWLLVFALVYYLWSCGPRVMKLLVVLVFFCVPAYFLGSKNSILTLLVTGIVYYNFRVKRFTLLGFIMFVGLAFFGVVGLLLAQGSYPSLLEGVLYFKDYFDTTAQFIARFDEFGFYYGRGWLSSLWFFVPRGLYADKPYEYGLLLIHEVLFPGAAASGNTPGVLEWALAYLDFGVIGVFLFGIMSGIWQRMAYEYFLKQRHQFFAFVLAMQFSIWPIWTFAPLLLVIPWSVTQSIFLKLRLRNRSRIKGKFQKRMTSIIAA